MALKTLPKNVRSTPLAHCLTLLGPMLDSLRRESSYADGILDVSTEPGATVANSLCTITSLLPTLAGVADQLETMTYGGAALGVVVEGKSVRTEATYGCYAGLYGGVMFHTRFTDYRLILRCTDTFWEGVVALSRCGGTLSYEPNEVMTAGLTSAAPARVMKPRSAVLSCIRDIVLASISEETRQHDLGHLAVSWRLSDGADAVLAGMVHAFRHFNTLNQQLHRLAYLDRKGRERRSTHGPL